eukprot:GILI01030843.1.p1 GENE.GILI01030843.1~~GILI01030843.1.p1  ORF type:complete len:426 (-),score=110.89 GILI01030843.1:101-1378(-)
MQSLQCGAQSYAWGKKGPSSKVAKLLGESDKPENAEKRFAELWIGVHTSLPSKVNGTTLLKDFLEANQDRYLGANHLSFYGNPTLPFLLKVLSIDMALSIQAHPTRDLAKKLHAKDPKNYPDPNHKPELIVALTPFEALCCFRPLKEIVFFIDQSAPLRAILGEKAIAGLRSAAVNEVLGGTTKDDAKVALRAALEAVYAVQKEALEASVSDQVHQITTGAIPSTASSIDAVNEVFVRTNKLFPGDVGLWMVYFLNYLRLNPGDALFLGAMEPHAYISGDGVEIMANSDNVVRAGLTPKFKDVDTLLHMLTYDTNALAQSKYTLDTSKAVQQYAPPSWCDDFSLFAVRLDRNVANRVEVSLDLPSVGLGLCVDGKAIVNAGAEVGFGSNFVLPVGKVTFSLPDGVDACTIFIGTTNVHGATQAKL